MIKKIAGYDTTEIIDKNDVKIITYKSLNGFKWLKNGFSTRIGGVSDGCFGKMNLSFTVGDDADTVRRNFEIFGDAFGCTPQNMVYSHQTHTTNVMRVDSSHKGMGIIKERNYKDIDGIVTNEPGLYLVTSYADCVPLYFVDPVHKAIGLSHSGWRGTVGNICRNTVELMKSEFSTKPSELVTCIGPSICMNCYEVSEDVADRFMDVFDKKECLDIVKPKENGKFLLNLHMANYYNMLNSGINPENISMPDICTSCNSDFLHSHRASKGQRGGLCAFLEISLL